MGVHSIKVPDIGEGIAEVELAAWNVKPGDMVTEDQSLADVMTDKATVEVPSPVNGTVLELAGKLGDLLAVGSVLIRIEVDGPGNESTEPGTRSAAPAAAAAKTPAIPAVVAPTVVAPVAAVPAAQPLRPAPATPAPAAASPTRAVRAPAIRAAGERPLASPAVRRRAWDMGIELKFVLGSGPAGQISHEDLDAYVAGSGGQAAPVSSQYARRSGEQAIPVVGMRRKIAQKMQESKRRIPHFSYVEEIDVTELEALRQRLNELYGKTRGKLTMLPFIMRAVVLAVRDFPMVNARYDDDAGVVTRYAAVHLGIAAQTDAGLMVPVVRHAETFDLWASAAEVGRLAEAARSGKALRDELSGSTLTITSLGPLGGIVSTPVINHPEVGIIGTNRMVERPMFRDGQVVARKLMNLSSSFDHRVVDGYNAAEFIQRVRALLEAPATLFVE